MEFKARDSRPFNGRSKRITWTARGVSAVAGTMIAGVLVASPAIAQSSIHSGKPVPPSKANSTAPANTPAKAQGLGGHGAKKHQKIVRAVVRADATLVRGQSFGAASSSRVGTAAGTYQVCFDVPVTNGTYNATIGLPGNVGEPRPGEINVVGRIGTNNCLFIQTFNSQGVLADSGFHVTVAYTERRRH